MFRFWTLGAALFGVSTATVVAVNPGMVTSAVTTLQQTVANNNQNGGTTGNTGGTPSIGSCRSRH